jgi:hypothetical protein
MSRTRTACFQKSQEQCIHNVNKYKNNKIKGEKKKKE